MQLMYTFMKKNIEWIFQQLISSDEKSQNVPNQILLTPSNLLHTMFHIGNQPFDQVFSLLLNSLVAKKNLVFYNFSI